MENMAYADLDEDFEDDHCIYDEQKSHSAGFQLVLRRV